MIDELNERFELLVKNPDIGQRQHKLADGTYRRFTCRSYVIYYRPMADGIVLARILHGARDHDRLL